MVSGLRLPEPLSFLNSDECPFVYDRELAKLGAQWVTPKIVATVKYAEWTDQRPHKGPGVHGHSDRREPRDDQARLAVQNTSGD